MKPVVPGTRHEWSVVPPATDTASAIGNPGVDVVSTPATIGYLEMTCHYLIEPFFETGEASVGTAVDIKHRAAAFPGTAVDCDAELLSAEGKRFRFCVAARQGGKLIMDGFHERAVVTLDTFLKTKPPKDSGPGRPEPPELVFWFDLHSPWAYLAARRIDAIGKRHKTAVAWRPFQLPRLIERINGRRPLEENAAFVNWFQQDLQGWAEIEDVIIRYHPQYPLPNSRALRACLYASDQGRTDALALALFKAYWQDEEDISDLSVIERIASASGFDGEAAAAAATDAQYKARLEANTDAAIERGLFGTPTVECGERLFFGFDRLPLLERHLSRIHSRPPPRRI